MIGTWNKHGFCVCSQLDPLPGQKHVHGWVFCPRKLHPFSNKYHTICLCKEWNSNSKWAGGEQRLPKGDGTTRIQQQRHTVGPLLHIFPLYFTFCCNVVLDFCFCIWKRIVELRQWGILACALIKTSQHWPTLVPGNAIDSRFNHKPIGECNAICGLLKNKRCFIWGMKEPDYVMKIMATGGALISNDSYKNVMRK